MVKLKLLALACSLALSQVPATAQDAGQAAPEIATGYADKAGWASKKFMVAAANPIAVDAGYAILKQGGAGSPAPQLCREHGISVATF